VRYFQTRFLEAAEAFIASLEKKTAAKVFYNIDLAEQTNDPKLFKKLQGEIWEFRTRYQGLEQYFKAKAAAKASYQQPPKSQP
jgi:hypothetical protein